MPTPPVSSCTALASDPRWAEVVRRDARADGSYYYSVDTTGIFCRPSCAARTPRPEHVRFHPSVEAAERAGFRACKRCRPGQASVGDEQRASVAELCRFIDQAERAPSLKELARRSAWSPYHLHRVFKSVTGLTPRAYASAARAARVRSQLQAGASVTEALHAAGFGSAGRFYEHAERDLGMKPAVYRAGGEREHIAFAHATSSLGALVVAASAIGVCAILLGDDAGELEADLRRRFPRALLCPANAEFGAWLSEVVACVEAPERGLGLPLDLRGTAFQARVWQALREIPAGHTRTYTEVALQIGAAPAVRAVARACAANPIAVAVPCHRVVRGDGSLAGYRWGIERKQALLAREAAPEPPARPKSSARGNRS